MDLPAAFRRITYADAMNTYGSDKPDLRFDLPIVSFDAFAQKSSFNASQALWSQADASSLVAPGCAGYSRSS